MGRTTAPRASWYARIVRVGERGSAAVQAAMLFPVVLLLVFGIIQGALWFHARHIALGAAQEGARAASAYDGTDAGQRAHEFVNDLTGGTLIRDLDVRVATTSMAVTVTVTGDAPSLVPGVGGVAVSQRASVPIETFTEAGS
ncbi:MAG: TadE family protein [bacterium]